MRPREALTRHPDGSRVAYMRPQDVPRSLPGDVREACASLVLRCGLSGARPNHKYRVSQWYYIGFEVADETLVFRLRYLNVQIVEFT